MTKERNSVRHPIFARILARAMEQGEEKGHAEHRTELLAGLSGRVIEIGAGTGLNFRHYPAGVSELVAAEPEPYLRGVAAEAAAAAAVPVALNEAVAEELPFDDGSFDAGVASLVLCSVHDPATALAELFRVIRAGGELRYYEHVLANRPGFARMQRAFDRSRLLPRLYGGDHVSRDTAALIAAAGFTIERERRFPFRPNVLAFPMTPHILGRARRPAQ